MALALMRSSRGHAARVLSQSQANPHPRPHANLTPIALDTPDKGPAHTVSTILDPTSRCCTDVHAEKSIKSDFAYSVRRAASPPVNPSHQTTSRTTQHSPIRETLPEPRHSRTVSARDYSFRLYTPSVVQQFRSKATWLCRHRPAV
jgi:hypothetical protein